MAASSAGHGVPADVARGRSDFVWRTARLAYVRYPTIAGDLGLRRRARPLDCGTASKADGPVGWVSGVHTANDDLSAAGRTCSRAVPAG